MSRDPVSAVRDLLGAAAELVEPLVVFADRGSYRVRVRGEDFVVKTDDDARTTSHEIAGLERAAVAGVRVPELVATADDALAMRWVEGVPLASHPRSAAWRDAGAQVRLAHDVGGGPPFGAGWGGFDPARPDWRSFFELFADTMLADCERDLGLAREQGDRIRAALRDQPGLDRAAVVWCHGDLQPEHVLVDPATDRVVAIIDWADHGAGDFVWDFAVLTLDGARSDAVLDGYGATREQRALLDALLPLYAVVRLAGEAGWLAEHGFPYAASLGRVQEWPA
jgi:aminoglycoside phosphotransferase (APT) family kinase protein